jgi:glutaredoxin
MASFRSFSIAALALLAAVPAHALFKVVGPDGKVTYTDRPPAANQGKVSGLTQSGAPAPDVTLPPELRQVTARWPVTLYTAPDCTPCDDARRLLRTRGVPHTEKTVMGDEDRAAWARIVGGPEAPGLTIGAQSLRGLQPERWHEYLDAAGYPRSSKLPPTYQFAAPLPLVPGSTDQAKAAAPSPRPAAPATGSGEPGAPPGFRF